MQVCGYAVRRRTDRACGFVVFTPYLVGILFAITHGSLRIVEAQVLRITEE